MEHDLINTIVISFIFAFIFGYCAKKMNMPTILGYLMAGVLIGPHTPGFVADTELAKQLAEIGIILLMFGVGLHFSPADLYKVKSVTIPGAFFQMLAATLIGLGMGIYLGFDPVASLLFGFSLSVASTIVLLRTLEDRGELQSEIGKVAVGWLIVEDIAMVLALVMLPVMAEILSGQETMTITSVITEVMGVLLKIAGFVILMMVFGRRYLPQILSAIDKLGSRELSSLGTLAIAMGFAFVAYVAFGASFALGAFLAGLVLNESEIGHKAAEQSLPMRDAFAVIFFVSVGMLFDPMTLWNYPLYVLLTVAIIVFGKIFAALCITTLFRQTREVSLTIAYSLGQIGEFSFILAGTAMAMNLMPYELYNLVLAGALISIAINPFLFKLLDYQLAKKS